MTVEYAKAAPDDIVIRITVTNRGPEAALLHLLPTLWFRNTWAWGRHPRRARPSSLDGTAGAVGLLADHHRLGRYWLAWARRPTLLFTDNETNAERLCRALPNDAPYVKDGIDAAVVDGGPSRPSTRPGPAPRSPLHYRCAARRPARPRRSCHPCAPATARSCRRPVRRPGRRDCAAIAAAAEADAFYARVGAAGTTDDERGSSSARRSPA